MIEVLTAHPGIFAAAVFVGTFATLILFVAIAVFKGERSRRVDPHRTIWPDIRQEIAEQEVKRMTEAEFLDFKAFAENTPTPRKPRKMTKEDFPEEPRPKRPGSLSKKREEIINQRKSSRKRPK